jgi:hypothetical protein
MRATSALLAGIVAVAGCDSNQTQPAQNVQSITVRSAEQEQLHKLNPLNRAIALKRAIYDSGYKCQRITRSGFVATYKNLDMWMAACADGRNWAVFTGPDGSAQVRDCADVASFGLPQCAIKGEDSGEAVDEASNSAS